MLTTGPHGFERIVKFTQDENPAVITDTKSGSIFWKSLALVRPAVAARSCASVSCEANRGGGYSDTRRKKATNATVGEARCGIAEERGGAPASP